MTYPGLRRNRQRAAASPPPAAVPRQAPSLPPSIPPPLPVQAAALTSHHHHPADDFERQATHLIPATVRMISGCHTEETSADCRNVLSNSTNLPHPAGRAGGACTSALLDLLYQHHHHHAQNNTNALSSKKDLTFQEILVNLRSKLAAQGFGQIPQLTSSRPLDVQATPFDLGGRTGTKRALLIGINYRGQVPGELSGCHNDVHNMRHYLTTVQGFEPHQILVLMDDGKLNAPTRKNIVLALRQLVAQSVAGDAVFVLYSGHGGLMDPAPANWFKKNGQKEFDETLYPVDHNVSGQIRDFNLYRHFVQPMPAGVTVTAVMDCCHSGSVLDLPYAFQPTKGGGMIRMQRNMDALANVGMLYLLMGGMFPPGLGFDSLTHHIEGVTGGNVQDFQGLGLDSQEDAMDGVDGGGVFDSAATGNDFGGGLDRDLDAYGGDAAYNLDGSPHYGMGAMEDDIDGDPITAVPVMEDSGAMYDGGYPMGGDWNQGDDFDGDGGGVDCDCLGDVLSSFLSDD